MPTKFAPPPGGATAARSSLLLVAFLSLVSVGDVWLVKLTLPLSMLLLPLVFVVFRPHSARPLPVGLFLLLGLLAIAALQVASGMSADVKADTAIWRPTLYAAATLFCLSPAVLPDDQIKVAIFAGGLATGGIMLTMILFAPSDLFLVPGQNISATAAAFQAQGHAGVASQFAPELSLGVKAFYGLKNSARNLLGSSNYIAVFLVFVFTVAIFTGHRVVACLMAALIAVTLARFGLLALTAAGACYFAHKRGVTVARICAGILGAGAVGLVVLYMLGPHMSEFSESLTVRLNFIRSGIDVAASHPLFGEPRSLLLNENGLNIVWSPHSSILQVAVYFGVVGVALYTAYLRLVFRSVVELSKMSDMWSGVSVGLSIVFAWSLIEIIVITPAFEILVAALYALASRKQAVCSPKHLAEAAPAE